MNPHPWAVASLLGGSNRRLPFLLGLGAVSMRPSLKETIMRATCTCGRKLEISREQSGQVIACPGCGKKIRIRVPKASPLPRAKLVDEYDAVVLDDPPSAQPAVPATSAASTPLQELASAGNRNTTAKPSLRRQPSTSPPTATPVPNRPQIGNVMAHVQQIANRAGIHCEQLGTNLGIRYELGGGRGQNVRVLEWSKTTEGLQTILIVSPCLQVPRGFNWSAGLGKSLLEVNAGLTFEAFCLMELQGQSWLCVKAAQILETMQPEEFRNTCESVAMTADKFEQQIGLDNF